MGNVERESILLMSNPGRDATETVSTVQESIRRHVKYSLGKAWCDLTPRSERELARTCASPSFSAAR